MGYTRILGYSSIACQPFAKLAALEDPNPFFRLWPDQDLGDRLGVSLAVVSRSSVVWGLGL